MRNFTLARRPNHGPALSFRFISIWLAEALLLASCEFALNPNQLNTTVIPLSAAPSRISFNDMAYDEKLGKVIIPAGGTGQLALIDPNTLEVKNISGFTESDAATNQAAGAISAAVARGLIYVLDAGALKLDVIDPSSGKLLGSTALQAAPDYVRYVAATGELWVTERVSEQIEVFKIPNTTPPIPISSGVISVPNGPEVLLIDKTRGVAYTNEPTIGKTAVIQVQTRGIIAEWGNGCSKARGMALDEQHGLLFIACNEGKVVMLDTANGGQQVTSQNYGAGLDDIGYNPRLHHVYVPSGASAILAIFGVDPAAGLTGAPSATTIPTATPAEGSTVATALRLSLVRLGTADTAVETKCLATDDRDNIWVCDPNKGRVLLIKDTFPANGEGW